MLKKSIILFCLVAAVSVSSFASDNKITTLLELKESQEILTKEIKAKTELKKQSGLDEEKERLKEEIKALDLQRYEIKSKFEKIATGIDTSLVQTKEEQQDSTLSEDFQLLLRPLVHGAKQATGGMRKKAQLKEEVRYYKMMLSEARKALKSISALSEEQESKALKKELTVLTRYWDQQVSLIEGNLNATQHRIDMLKKNDISFTESFQSSTKNFFQQQGRVLLEGIGAFLLVVIVTRLLQALFVKIFPVFTSPTRTFNIRIIDLLYRILTTLLALLVPMAVFYYEEDWLLSSIGMLILLGILWTFRNLIPKLWQQARLLLNIGSVRQEERLYYQNLPWKVKNINIFTVLENPDSGVRLRLPIEELVGLVSRPILKYEPWFPCRQNDWVMLSDEYFGKVIGISLEFVELVDTGGGHKTYIVSDFLSLSPLNLSTGFRVFETIGISYRHQKESTHEIVDTLEKFITQKLEEEGYSEGLTKLLVQFSQAGDSSLDIAVIASFNGDMAPRYYRLRRAIRRLCVDACTEYGWEIPFPQLTIHQPKS